MVKWKIYIFMDLNVDSGKEVEKLLNFINIYFNMLVLHKRKEKKRNNNKSIINRYTRIRYCRHMFVTYVWVLFTKSTTV